MSARLPSLEVSTEAKGTEIGGRQEIGRICDLFEPAECQNYFTAAGYGFS